MPLHDVTVGAGLRIVDEISPAFAVAQDEQTHAAEGTQGKCGGGSDGGHTFASRLRQYEYGIHCRAEGLSDRRFCEARRNPQDAPASAMSN